MATRTTKAQSTEALVNTIVTRVLAQLTKPESAPTTPTTPTTRLPGVPAVLTVELPPQSGKFRKIKGEEVVKVTDRAQQILAGQLEKGRGLVILAGGEDNKGRRALVHTGK